MDSHIFALLQQLQVEQDPELDALVQELDSKFQALSLEGEAKSGELGEPGITVESAALDKIPLNCRMGLKSLLCWQYLKLQW